VITERTEVGEDTENNETHERKEEEPASGSSSFVLYFSVPLTTLGALCVDACLSHGVRLERRTWRRRAPAEGNA